MAQCSDAFLKSTFINHGLLAALLRALPMHAFETGKMESVEALPYHRFTVPPFPLCVSTSVFPPLYVRAFFAEPSSTSITETNLLSPAS